MSEDPHYEQLREISWRRKLTPSEEASLSNWLAAHPEKQAEWDLESDLSQAVAALSDVPVASNFTARVLDAARRESLSREHSATTSPQAVAWWIRWLPTTALAAVVLAAGLLCYHHVLDTRRSEWAQSLATVSQVPSLPGPEILKDFDTIAALSSTPVADEELLRVMQ